MPLNIFEVARTNVPDRGRTLRSIFSFFDIFYSSEFWRPSGMIKNDKFPGPSFKLITASPVFFQDVFDFFKLRSNSFSGSLFRDLIFYHLTQFAVF